jgi:hypothetical protein
MHKAGIALILNVLLLDLISQPGGESNLNFYQLESYISIGIVPNFMIAANCCNITAYMMRLTFSVFCDTFCLRVCSLISASDWAQLRSSIRSKSIWSPSRLMRWHCCWTFALQASAPNGWLLLNSGNRPPVPEDALAGFRNPLGIVLRRNPRPAPFVPWQSG